MAIVDHALLDEQGYIVVRDFLDRTMTRRLREHMDSLLPPIAPPEQEGVTRVNTLRHPIPGAIMAKALNRPALLDLAAELIHADDMRLLEQVLIRTDPRPAPHGPGGWHIDFAFLPEDYNARPRRTYFHMVHALSTVEPGGGAFMIVPGSHRKTYQAAGDIGDRAGLKALKDDPIGVASIDVSRAIEVPADEGDLIIFNPMCLHSASGNARDTPRYVYFASFADAGATDFWAALDAMGYHKGFSESLRDNLPAALSKLLER